MVEWGWAAGKRKRGEEKERTVEARREERIVPEPDSWQSFLPGDKEARETQKENR